MSAQATSLSRLRFPPVSTSTPGKPGIWTSFHSTPWISGICQDATMQQMTPSPVWMMMLWDFHTLAAAQREDDSATAAASTSLDLQRIPLPTTDVTLLCDHSTGTPRPYVPPNLQRPIFYHFHGLSHPGVQATQSFLTSR